MSSPKPKMTVPRVFQSFFGQTFSNSLMITVQSLLLCSACVTISGSPPKVSGWLGGGGGESGFGAMCWKLLLVVDSDNRIKLGSCDGEE